MLSDEIGMEPSLLDGWLVLNAALFRADCKNFQFFFLDLATGQQIIRNLESVDIWGFDLDSRAALSDQISVFGRVGYTDSEIKKIGSSALQAGLMAAGVNIDNVIGSKRANDRAETSHQAVPRRERKI